MYDMPKSREVSIERRAQVLALHEAGNLMREIFLQLHIPRSIGQKIISRFHNTRNYRSIHLLGMPRITSRHMYKLMKRLCRQNPHITASEKSGRNHIFFPHDEKLFGVYLKCVSNGNFWCYGIC